MAAAVVVESDNNKENSDARRVQVRAAPPAVRPCASIHPSTYSSSPQHQSASAPSSLRRFRLLKHNHHRVAVTLAVVVGGGRTWRGGKRAWEGEKARGEEGNKREGGASRGFHQAWKGSKGKRSRYACTYAWGGRTWLDQIAGSRRDKKEGARGSRRHSAASA
jgi:hypothetical protein